jgi:hypothetical protein
MQKKNATKKVKQTRNNRRIKGESTWDALILDAERKLDSVTRRARQLEGTIAVFRRKRDEGEPTPFDVVSSELRD